MSRKRKGRPSREVEDASVLAHIRQPHTNLVGRNAEHPVTIAVCRDAVSNYCTVSGVPWGSLCQNLLFLHEEREVKNGPAVIFGELHHLRDADHIWNAGAFAYEIDGKATLDEGFELVEASGEEAVVWTTHNHLRTNQTVALGTFRKSQGGAPPTDASMQRFCAAHPRYNHLKNVSLLNEGKTRKIKEWGQWIDVYDIGHDPEDKFRIVFPLAEPVPILNAGIGIDGFKRLYHAHGQRVLGDRYSSESANPVRLHFLGSHRLNATFSALHFEGSLTDWKQDWNALEADVETQRVTAQSRRAERANRGPTAAGDLEQVLESIPPDLPYPDWFRVLAALHHETDGGDIGIDLAHAWSERDPRYEWEQVEQLWDSLDPDHNNPATMGTLVALARKHDPGFHLAASANVDWLDEFFGEAG